MTFIICIEKSKSISMPPSGVMARRELKAAARHFPNVRMRKNNQASHHPLRLGFVALSDCAPLVMAAELGLFAEHGLDVALQPPGR